MKIVAYAYGATGVAAGSVGVQAYGAGLAGNGQRAVVGGGRMVWGSPVDRLTLIADGARDIFGNFAPSAAAVVRLVGNRNDGFALGVIGKYKVDVGFCGGSSGPCRFRKFLQLATRARMSPKELHVPRPHHRPPPLPKEQPATD